ncbi:hypothetical protein ACIP4T_11930 [Streptomyces massasporeus]|uniref:hypothetical protein n=1 Tax=Streptomyces massasporeus TaxID=67324 RepID=UPI0036E44516
MGRSAAGAATWVVGEAGTAYELHLVLQYASCPPYREPAGVLRDCSVSGTALRTLAR